MNTPFTPVLSRLTPGHSGRVRDPSHRAFSAKLPGSPIVKSFRDPSNASFSHIQIISNPSPASFINSENSSPIIFQSPSYTQEVEKSMAAPYVIEGSNLTASLANNTSGTTFAAKARAAELNAVRSRKAVKDMEMEDEVSSANPVALGAIKFTRPRNRGKGWKALNLDELPEESIESDEAFGEGTHDTRSYNSQFVPNINYHNYDTGRSFFHETIADSRISYHPTATPALSYQESMDSPKSQTLEKAVDNVSIGNERSHDLSRSSSALSNLHKLEVTSKYNPTQGIPPDEVSKSYEAKNNQQSVLLNGFEEERLRNLGVLPALKQSNIVSHPKQRGDDDPFVERSPDLQRNLFRPYAQDQADNSSLLGHNLPPAVKGTTRHEFHLPSTQIGSLQQNTIKSRHDQLNIINPGARGGPYQRDPMPYSSFAMSSKKDMLLQNLHEVVESSKAQGNLPVSTRTVLYDPLTRDSGRNAHNQGSAPEVLIKENSTPSYKSFESYLMSTNSDKELLKGSDALPWTDRPVNIQNTVSPLAVRVGVPVVPLISTPKKPPPGLGYDNADIWSLRPQPRTTGRSLEEAESWFMKNSRGGEELQLQSYHGAARTTEPLKPIGDRSTLYEQSSVESGKKDITLWHGIPIDNPTDVEIAKALFQPVFENLVNYLESPSKSDYFGRFARVPEWCIDKSQDGNQSFFGDWGVPPSRVGRDPRYRPTFHEGRYTVYEELDRRGGRDGTGRRFL